MGELIRDYTHASFFSGIGAFDLGLEQAGFRPVSHAEVKPFSCSVLESRWPGVPNLGDINAICPDGEGEHDCVIPPADVWTGGFPCSDFSIMGKRKGLLGGNRSSLGLVFLDLVRRHRPPFVILENVPGILSSHEGRDFGLLLGVLVDIGYGWSYRLLDARNFGLPQARRRIFLVAAADPADAAAVLDDSTDRRVDAAQVGRSRRAVVARGRDGAVGGPPFVLGPTYAPESVNNVRTDGTTFPLTPTNIQYVVDDTEPVAFHVGERAQPAPVPGVSPPIRPPSGGAQRVWVAEHSEPVVVRREGNFPTQSRRDGTVFTIMPAGGTDHGEQYLVEPEPIVIRREGTFEPQLRADGSAFTILPSGAGERSNIGQQYVVDRGPGPVVVYPTFSKRDQQRLASRADGSSYTLLPGAAPFVLEPWDDDDDGGLGGGLLDERRGDGDGGGGSGAPLGSGAPAAPDRPADQRAEPAGEGEAPDADRVRAAAGVPGQLDGPDGGGAGDMGPQHLDTARWHVLGRACPVPIVEWMGLALRTVIDDREGRRVGRHLADRSDET